ncbi:MAG: NAD-dependent epimerase/dehydratase family protein [Thermoleophilia bacterium]|nr:NAD-dependent epimerase/dehydratase family protein [Thermoleophilia bacterium]
MKVLITGGAGFIGSHTAELLIKAGHEVRVLDDFSAGNSSNLATVKKEIDLVEADILDLETVSAACLHIEVVFHLAAISSVEQSIQEPLRTHAVNASGTLNVLEAARRASVRRVIYSSSAAVYGDHPELPKKESSPVQPRSPYAWHKLSSEFYGQTYAELSGLEFIALRYFNVYGPRQDPESPYSGVLSIFVRSALDEKPLIIYGDGLQTRDFIHVSDVARVNLLAAEAKPPQPPVINVGTGGETRIIDAAEMIQAAAGISAGITYGPPRAGDIHRSCADTGLLEKTYGSQSWVSIADGLQHLVMSSRKNHP